jgi:hypothetical protein
VPERAPCGPATSGAQATARVPVAGSVGKPLGSASRGAVPREVSPLLLGFAESQARTPRVQYAVGPFDYAPGWSVSVGPCTDEPLIVGNDVFTPATGGRRRLAACKR